MKFEKSGKSNMRLQHQQLDWHEKLQLKVECAIASFSHAHMSNTKWRKAFIILAAPGLALTRCHWKLVADKRVFVTPLPSKSDLLEAHLADGAFQPEFVYREIEWIEIPAQYQLEDKGRSPRIVYQNISGALEALSKVGKFPAELTETGLVIRGYS